MTWRALTTPFVRLEAAARSSVTSCPSAWSCCCCWTCTSLAPLSTLSKRADILVAVCWIWERVPLDAEASRFSSPEMAPVMWLTSAAFARSYSSSRKEAAWSFRPCSASRSAARRSTTSCWSCTSMVALATLPTRASSACSFCVRARSTWSSLRILPRATCAWPSRSCSARSSAAASARASARRSSMAAVALWSAASASSCTRVVCMLAPLSPSHSFESSRAAWLSAYHSPVVRTLSATVLRLSWNCLEVSPRLWPACLSVSRILCCA
mmetsp:Transcript_120288/g.340844  ORF Transcript_120288/g.340844 Transcript_120288/m.340844 type:complete len:268 (+) Transcript_120288:402-1205(+)